MIKTCSSCKVEKKLSEFRRDKSKADGFRYECKLCSRTRQNAAYTVKYGESARQRNRERHKANAERVDEIKSSGCTVCGEMAVCCLEFHHPDPTAKEFTIAQAKGRLSWERVQAEINKCVILCSNCHKKVHAGLIDLNGS